MQECDRDNYDDTTDSNTTIRKGFRPIFDPVATSRSSENKPSKSSLRNQMAMCVKSLSANILENDSSSDSDTLLPGKRIIECIKRSQKQRLAFRNPTRTRQEFLTFKGKASATHDDTTNTSYHCIKERLPTSSENFVGSEILRPVLPPQDCDQHEYSRSAFHYRVPILRDVIRNSTNENRDDYLERNRFIGGNKRAVNDEARSMDEMEESSKVTAKRAEDFRREDGIRVVTFEESSNGATSIFSPSYDESSTTRRWVMLLA